MANTQFEVYVFKQGRWTFNGHHAKRNEALRDARLTEFNARLPTKVVRETYFPDQNSTENVTIYASSKVKALQRPALPRREERAGLKVVSKPAPRRAAGSAVAATDTVQLLLQTLEAVCISLFFATIFTGVIAAMLRVSPHGLASASDANLALLLYCYIGAFLLLFLVLFRRPLPVQRLIAEWRARSRATVRAPAHRQLPPTPADFSRGPAAHTEEHHRPLRRNGDISVPAAGQETDAATGRSPSVEPATLTPRAEMEVPAAERGECTRDSDGASPSAPPEPSAARDDPVAADWALLRRFVHHVVRPAARILNEPMREQGISIVLAGGVDGLGNHIRTDHGAPLLDFAFDCAGFRAGVAASFLGKRDEPVAADKILREAGAKAMREFRPLGEYDPAHLALAFRAWCKAKGYAPDTARENDEPVADTLPALIDVLLLAEVRSADGQSQPALQTDLTDTDQDPIVCTVLKKYRGCWVKCDNGRIFARFARADAAIEAAFEIMEARESMAITMIGNSDIAEDPWTSPALFQHAEAALRLTPASTISAEVPVYTAATLPLVVAHALADGPGAEKVVRLSRITNSQLSAEAEAQVAFEEFTRSTLETIEFNQLNAFSRFGLHLYLAGAASVIGEAKRLPRDVQLAILRDGLQRAECSQERAEAFCIELPRYRKNQRYAVMVDAGVAAMQQTVAATGPVASAASLLREWCLPEKRPVIPSMVTFLFTDMVGSMAMTMELGNTGAQKVLRVHNTVVRSAISTLQGREIKHTGDGIMATFPDPGSAVMAAIQMQRHIAQHNAIHSTAKIKLRIGINAGDAVEEENDFFGIAVQMTARICKSASENNVWVSEAIVDACDGLPIAFVPRGRLMVKGIQYAKPLYEVVWRDSATDQSQPL